MKYKKISYLVLFLLMLVVGVDGAYAAKQKKPCYYMTPYEDDNFNATLNLYWGYEPNGIDFIEDFAQVFITTIAGDMPDDQGGEPLLNWLNWGGASDNEIGDGESSRETVTLEWFHENQDKLVDGTVIPTCPTYLIFEYDYDGIDEFSVWGTNDLNKAKKAVSESNANNVVRYASRFSGDGKDDGKNEPITKEEYMSAFVKLNDIDLDVFEKELVCEDLFGSESDPNSLHSMINLIMQYVRIIVPILIILLGTVDFAKAVMAGKEDNMRKAQWDFVKRILIGVIIFFVPVLVNVIMDLAEIVWQGERYNICKFFG